MREYSKQLKRDHVIPVTIPESKFFIQVDVVKGRPRVTIFHPDAVTVDDPIPTSSIEGNLDQSTPIEHIQP
jgi:hypothetical protein